MNNKEGILIAIMVLIILFSQKCIVMGMTFGWNKGMTEFQVNKLQALRL